MTTAVLNDLVLADSDETVVVEGNHYFPTASVNWDVFSETTLTTGCPWKGTANYYTVTIGEETWENVAWTYHTPKDGAIEIKDHLAFYPLVTVS